LGGRLVLTFRIGFLSFPITLKSSVMSDAEAFAAVGCAGSAVVSFGVDCVESGVRALGANITIRTRHRKSTPSILASLLALCLGRGGFGIVTADTCAPQFPQNRAPSWLQEPHRVQNSISVLQEFAKISHSENRWDEENIADCNRWTAQAAYLSGPQCSTVANLAGRVRPTVTVVSGKRCGAARRDTRGPPPVC
jgi:hypothetical protein